VRPSGAPIPIDEVRAKIDVLMKEKTEHAAASRAGAGGGRRRGRDPRAPADGGGVAGRVDTEVRFNLLVRQK
jgi:hypothetical protein